LTGQVHPKTSIVYEYPQAEGDPYYPVPRAENTEIYEQYKALAEATPNVRFVGRLATYRYYNMDQVVAQALKVYRTIVAGGSEKLELPAKIGRLRTMEPAEARAVNDNSHTKTNGNGSRKPS
jgi:UDP-galactopyranose mutase